MLYGIDGKPLAQDKELETAQRLYHVQLMNMTLYQRDMLQSIVSKCNDALDRIDGPDHKFEKRIIGQIRDEALEATKQETVAGFISGTQARLAYEICERLITEARLFDQADADEPTTECEDLVRVLIARMLEKLAPESIEGTTAAT